MPQSADIEAVSQGTILLRHKESREILDLPMTEQTPRVVMLRHAGDLEGIKKSLMEAVDSDDISKIVEALKLYAKWRFVTGHWVRDMEAVIAKTHPPEKEES